MKTKRVIGITGGIGSGKSLVASLFNSLGFPVYNSDVEAKKIYFVPEVRELVIELLGSRSYTDGELNRSYIGQLVFSDSKLLSSLNKIIHPAVTKHFNEWVRNQDNSILLKEAAVLIESGAYKRCDAIITVSAEEQIRIQRVIKRDHVSESDVKARMDNQLSDSEREKYANWTIINDGSASLIKQIMEIYHSDFSIK